MNLLDLQNERRKINPVTTRGQSSSRASFSSLYTMLYKKKMMQPYLASDTRSSVVSNGSGDSLQLAPYSSNSILRLFFRATSCTHPRPNPNQVRRTK